MKLAAIVYALSLTKNTPNHSRHLDSYIPNRNQDTIDQIRELFSLYDTNDDGESWLVFLSFVWLIVLSAKDDLIRYLYQMISPLWSTIFSIGVITIEELQAFQGAVGQNRTIEELMGIINAVSWLLLRHTSSSFGTSISEFTHTLPLSFELI